LYFCRDLVDANQPCDVDLIDLSQALRDIFEEFRPVAEESRVSFEALVGPELWIRGNLNRLMQALTRIMDCVLAASPRSIRLEPDAQGYRINLMGARPDALAVEQSRSLELARVLLNAMHCELTSTDNAIAINTDDPQGGAGPSNAGPQTENTDSNELVSR
jgi:signal transduction histidine kinase